MPGSGIRDDVAPWSFFLPVTLAVVVGVLAAGLVQRGIDRVFPGDDRRDAVSDAASPEDEPASRRGEPAAAQADTEADVPAVPEPGPESEPDAIGTRDADDASVAASLDARASRDTVPAEETGAIVAIRERAPEACINGTIAIRNENGWQQRLENDAPVACVEQSVAPR